MPVERHLVGFSGVRDGFDAHRVNAVTVEELASHREYALPRGTAGLLTRFRRGAAQRFAHGILTRVLPVSTV
jgi:hypothetical protein